MNDLKDHVSNMRPSAPPASPVRTGTVLAHQSETHNELTELESSLTRLEAALGLALSSIPKPGNTDGGRSVGGLCDVAQSASSAANRVAGARDRVDEMLNRLQLS